MTNKHVFMSIIHATHFLFFISFNCLVCHKIYSHLQDIFCFITTFMHLYSDDICQLIILYV